MRLSTVLPRLKPLARIAGAGLLDALYPLECAGCGRTGGIICERCSGDLPELRPPFCQVCAAPGDFALCPKCTAAPRHFDGLRAPFLYQGTVRNAILELKYGGTKAAAIQLGDFLSRCLQNYGVCGDVLLPVPMHPSRRKDRGYNQAELLARRIANVCDLDCRTDWLIRTREVGPQAGVNNASQRIINVAESVEVICPSDVRGADVILVDDVATTGSTLDVCAKALKEAGASSVWGLTLAVALRHSSTE